MQLIVSDASVVSGFTRVIEPSTGEIYAEYSKDSTHRSQGVESIHHHYQELGPPMDGQSEMGTVRRVRNEANWHQESSEEGVSK